MDMINFFQLGIGLIPAVIVMAFLMIRYKLWKLKNILATVAVLAISITFMSVSVIGKSVEERTSYKNVSKGITLDMCYALVAEGRYDMAEEIISDFTVNGIYDKDISLARARIEILRGNYKNALGIIDATSASADATEVEYLRKITGTTKSDIAIFNFAKAHGVTLGAGEELSQLSGSEENELVNHVKQLATNRCGEKHRRAATIMVAIEAQYDAFMTQGSAYGSEAEELRNGLLRVISETPEFETIHLIRIVRLKADVMTGSYGDAVRRLRADSFYDEYMIASELFITGLVNANDFGAEFNKYTRSELAEVSSRLDKVLEAQRGKLSDKEFDELERIVVESKKKYEEPIAVALIDGLEKKIENKEVEGNDTKVHLQIGKIENFCGDERAAREKIFDAMDSVGLCNDANYVDPMVELINIATGDGGENVKNIGEYVEYVLDNTVPVETGSTPAYREKNNGDEESGDFRDVMTNTVIESSVALTISSINTENFEEIEAMVVFSEDEINGEDLAEKHITVKDCGVEIENFTLEKLEFEGSRVMLVCDNSGSMGGSIGTLQDAVRSFIDDKGDDEKLAIVTFDSGILEETGFTDNASELTSVIDGMSDRGGTNIYGTVMECLGRYNTDEITNRIMIVMTDGADGYYAQSDEIYENIAVPAKKNGITVYTIGLGASVDTEYLKMIAEYTGGNFIYAPAADDLETFYALVRSKMNNQYRLRYTAVDTLTTTDRTLEVAIKSSTGKSDEKTYNIGNDDTTLFSVNDGVSIYGINPKQIYKSHADATVRLTGEGFENGQPVSVKIKGNLAYDIKATFVDEYNLELVIPSGVAADTYDVEVLIGGKRAYLVNELTVINPDSISEFKFGPYKFTASSISRAGDKYTLRGGVSLNDWLNFRGDVILEGNPENGSIRFTDNSGSYVSYNAGVSQGLAKTLAEKGISLEVRPLGSLNLYNDTDNYNNYEEYRADESTRSGLRMAFALNLPDVTIKLLPDRMSCKLNVVTTLLPFQDTIFMFTGDKSPFKFDLSFTEECVITDRNIGIIIDTSYEEGDDEDDEDDGKKKKNARYGKAKVSNLPVQLDYNNTAVKINTLENDFSIDFGLKVEEFFGIEGVSFGMEWDGGKFDAIRFGIDKKIKTMIGNVPVTFRNFGFEVSDLSEIDHLTVGELLKAVLKGSLDVEIMNVDDVLPKVAKYLHKKDEKDEGMCVLSLPETTAEIRIRDFKLDLNAKLMFLKTIELASAEIHIGNFNFKNVLLAADDNACGLQAAVTAGIKWKNDNLDLDLSGEIELDAHSKFVGGAVAGTAKLELKLWKFSIDKSANGEALIGFHFPDGQKKRFVIGYKSAANKGKVKSYLFYIDEDGKVGKNKNFL